MNAGDYKFLKAARIVCDQPIHLSLERELQQSAEIYKASAENWIKIASSEHNRAEDATAQSTRNRRAFLIASAIAGILGMALIGTWVAWWVRG